MCFKHALFKDKTFCHVFIVLNSSTNNIISKNFMTFYSVQNTLTLMFHRLYFSQLRTENLDAIFCSTLFPSLNARKKKLCTKIKYVKKKHTQRYKTNKKKTVLMLICGGLL